MVVGGGHFTSGVGLFALLKHFHTSKALSKYSTHGGVHDTVCTQAASESDFWGALCTVYDPHSHKQIQDSIKISPG